MVVSGTTGSMRRFIAGTYNWLSRTVLDLRVDQQFIDAIANGLGNLTRRVSGWLAPPAEWFRAQLCAGGLGGCGRHYWLAGF